jgi:hypothetical protein
MTQVIFNQNLGIHFFRNGLNVEIVSDSHPLDSNKITIKYHNRSYRVNTHNSNHHQQQLRRKQMDLIRLSPSDFKKITTTIIRGINNRSGGEKRKQNVSVKRNELELTRGKSYEFTDDALVDEEGDGDAEYADEGEVAASPAEAVLQVLSG